MIRNSNKFDGELITGINGCNGGKVYYIENSKKRWIISPEAFRKMGFRGEEIMRIPDDKIEAITTDASINDGS
jgi:hypothetical protein